jgi:tetratricopeptide (TPR) repeat protein
MRVFLTTATVAALCLAGGPARAAMTIIGGGQAEACYQAAKAGKSDRASINICDLALDTEALTPEDRGGTLVNRGVMELRQGMYEVARADFNAGIAINPNVGEGFVNRGAMFIGERRYKEALADIDKALALGLHEPAKAYYDRALAYEGLDDEKSAYLDYQQALVLQPGWELPQHELLRFTVTHR